MSFSATVAMKGRKRLANTSAGVWLHRLLLVLLLPASISHSASAVWEQHAKPSTLAPANSLAPTSPRGVSVEKAIRIVRSQTGGRILAATEVTRKGRQGVSVRTLLDGERVTTFFVNADGRIQKH